MSLKYLLGSKERKGKKEDEREEVQTHFPPSLGFPLSSASSSVQASAGNDVHKAKKRRRRMEGGREKKRRKEGQEDDSHDACARETEEEDRRQKTARVSGFDSQKEEGKKMEKQTAN